MYSKDTIVKPSIYIASDYNGDEVYSNLDIATSIEINPFIQTIFTVEGLYAVDKLSRLSGQYLSDLGMTMLSEMELADIFIIDLRAGDPIELGYALATDTSFILFNPENRPLHPLAHGQALKTVQTLDELADINYLKLNMKGK